MHLLLAAVLACTPASRPRPATPADSSPDPEGDPTTTPGGDTVLAGARLPGGTEPVALFIEDGRIAALGRVPDPLPEGAIDLSGRWLAPAFIDSHVHLAYLPAGAEMLDGGVAAAVDLAAPDAFFDEDLSPLVLLRAGPMITAPGGYPTTSWGRNGYGIEVEDSAAALAAVETLVEAGARLIKIPLAGGPELSDPTLEATIERAHALGVPVAVHALDDASALRAARAGADLLAHTPTGPLSEATVAAWADRIVISTLSAFGGRETTVENLRRLRAAGATVLYGTDFGNVQQAGILEEELAVLGQAGLDGAAILAAGTETPAATWGLEGLGRIEIGARASLLVLTADPLVEPQVLSRPEAVWIDGNRR